MLVIATSHSVHSGMIEVGLGAKRGGGGGGGLRMNSTATIRDV